MLNTKYQAKFDCERKFLFPNSADFGDVGIRILWPIHHHGSILSILSILSFISNGK